MKPLCAYSRAFLCRHLTTGLIESLPAEVTAKLLPQSSPVLARLHTMLGIDTITVPKFLAAYVVPNYLRLPDMAQAQLLTYMMETWCVP